MNYLMQGYTPLHLASDRGHLSVVRILIDSGADRTIEVRAQLLHDNSKSIGIDRILTGSLRINWP
jgi:ankyrin repeat protein